MADMQTESETEEKCHVCKDCRKAFDAEVDFEVHLCVQTRKCPLLCSSEKKHHKNTDTGEKPHVCPYCQLSTSSSYLSKDIVKKPSIKFEHNCSFCSRGYVHEIELQKHIQTTHSSEETDESIAVKKEKGEAGENQTKPDQMHCCTHCTYVTKKKPDLVRHLWTHSGHRPYQCEVCNKGYTQNAQLRDHLCTHAGERPYICNTCGRGFTFKSILQNHEKLHPEEERFLRDTSKSEITESTNSPVNVKSLQNKRSVFQCPFCRRTFLTKKSLLLHVRIHTNKYPYVCDTCKKGFATQKALTSHKSTHLNVMHRCPVCPFSTSLEYSLGVHLKIHSLNEPQPVSALPIKKCELRNGIGNMEKHLDTSRGSGSFQCRYCWNRFTKKELVKHGTVCKEKHPFTCSTCGLGFYTLSYLEFHESLHTTSESQKMPPVKKELQDST